MDRKGKEPVDNGRNTGSSPPPTSSSSDSPSSTQKARDVLRKPVAKAAEALGLEPSRNSRPSVRIRRTPSSSSIAQQPVAVDYGLGNIQEEEESSRRRSSSEPQRPSWFKKADAGDRLAHIASVDQMPTVEEGQPSRFSLRAPRQMVPHLSPHLAPHLESGDPEAARQMAAHLEPHTEPYLERTPSNNVFRRIASAAQSPFRRTGASDNGSINLRDDDHDEYDNQMVDLLDVIDPEVSTLTTLTNVQNSLFVPNLGRFLNRRPTYNLTRGSTAGGSRPATAEPPVDALPITHEETEDSTGVVRPRLTHTSTISSTLSESRYAVLPHGETLYGWTPEEKAELNDLVRHMLHSKRAAFKRGMKGFGQYIRRPLGFFVTLYAFLITMFGLAWVLFLIGWISVGNRKDYLVNVVDNVLVALFAIMGDGLIPFRLVDTYHMIYIAHYHHLTWRLRREKSLPKLENRNDLPAKVDPNVDLEEAAVDAELRREYRGTFEVSVLSPAQQKKLQHHQAKFANSHTFYKPHETDTHYAFPLRILVAIVVLLDFHSIFQVALGACTWSINYKVRPFALTTVILCCSICCNITGGILISVGDKRTRKKEVIEKMFRQELTHDAMKKVRDRRIKENEKAEDSDVELDALPIHVPPPVQELETDMDEAMKAQNVEIATGTRRESKNKWNLIPKVPKMMRKEKAAIEKARPEE